MLSENQRSAKPLYLSPVMPSGICDRHIHFNIVAQFLNTDVTIMGVTDSLRARDFFRTRRGQIARYQRNNLPFQIANSIPRNVEAVT